MVAVLCLFFQGLKWSMGLPLYCAFLGCSHSMELWLITSLWPTSCSALCASTHACWKGSYSFMLVQEKAITTHMREYIDTLPCAFFALLIPWYVIILGGEWGVSIVGKYGKAYNPLPAVNRCYLTTSASIVRSLNWNATQLFHILKCSGFQFVNNVYYDRLIFWKGWLRARSRS